MSEFASRWLDAKSTSLRPSTAASYCQVLDSYVLPRIGHIELRKLDGPTLTAMYGELLRSGATGARGWIAWALLLLTGARRGEALGLDWCDIDLRARRITIRQSYAMAGTTPVLGSPKTLAGSRTIAIDDSLAEALRLWRVEQRRQRLAAPEWVESDAVVTEPNGEHVHPQVLTRRFSALCRSASLPTIRLHDLRHTVASVALASGEDVAVISKCLGHADIAVTLRLYRHVYTVEDEAAAQRLGQLFTGTA